MIVLVINYQIVETMKKFTILFWISTILIVLFEGVMPALFFNTEMAREGIRHLGYPVYFGTAVVVFKILGALALIIPQVPHRLKEWAYAGFAYIFIFAAISHAVVDGFAQALFPLIALIVLAVSYYSYHKIGVGRQTI